MWHDHRIHVQDGAEFSGGLDWTVPISVDDVPTTISGRLDRVDPPSPLPFLGLAVARRRGSCGSLGRSRPGPSWLRSACWPDWWPRSPASSSGRACPDSVARNAGVFLLPLGAAVAAVIGLVLRRRTPALVALLASVSLLAGWLAFRWSILTRSVLVSDLAPLVDRIALAVVLGVVLAAAGLTVQWAGAPDPRPGTGVISRAQGRRSAPAPPGPWRRAAG